MPKPSKEFCLSDLQKRILTTELAPGADLDEVTLSEHYGISRTPLREVLQRLAGRGYAQQSSNRGTKVASMDVGVLRVFFQTAPMIYANIARLAAENRTVEQLAELRAIQGKFAQALADGDATKAALGNHAFHAQIGEMAHNPYLQASLARMLIDHTRLSQTFYRPEGIEETQRTGTACAQHDAMIKAFEARDAERAVALTLQHWDLSRTRIERFVRPDPLPITTPTQEDQAHAV